MENKGLKPAFLKSLRGQWGGWYVDENGEYVGVHLNAPGSLSSNEAIRAVERDARFALEEKGYYAADLA
jgi:hypothetical protein